MTDRAYRTFWPRFAAGIVDSLAIGVPLGILSGVAAPESYGAPGVLVWSAFMSVLLISYTVVMTACYGQTLGKMAAGVIVLDVGETRRPSFTQAWLRDIGTIAPQVLLIGYMAAAVLSGERDPKAAGFDLFDEHLTTVMGVWFWIEIFTMLFSDRRRALHDVIAGTVVMRKASVQFETVR